MATRIFEDEPTFHQDYIPNEESNPLNSGPFGWGSYTFGVFVDTLTNHIEVWASATNWSSKVEMDAGNKPSCAAANFGVNDPTDLGYGWETCDAVQHPTLPELYICYLDTSDRLTIKVFNLNSGTWGATLSGGPVPTVRGSNPEAYLFLAYRLQGNNFLVGYYSPSGQGKWMAPCTRAGVWGASFEVPVDSAISTLRAVVTANYGGTSKTHLFYLASGGPSLEHRVVNEDNTLAAKQVPYDPSTLPEWTALDRIGIGRPVVSATGEVIMPVFVRWNTLARSSIVIVRGQSAALPAWTVQTAVDGAPGTPFKLAVQAGFLRGAIFFTVTATLNVINDGRLSPYWDIPQSTWWSAIAPVAITGNQLYVVYAESFPYAIYAATYAAIGGWGAPFLVASAADFAAAGPAPRLFRICTGVRGGGSGNMNSILGASRQPKVA